MYLVTAVPIVSIPRPGEQVFSYFFTKPLRRGVIVDVPFANRIVNALVLKSESLASKKMQVKSASYKLKEIKRVVTENVVLEDEEIKFAIWASDYFFASLGLFLKMIIPSYLIKRGDADYQSVKITKTERFSSKYFAGDGRLDKYKEIIKRNTRAGQQTLVVFPEILAASVFLSSLPKDLRDQTVLWRSRTTPKKEFEARIKILTAETKIVVGTRSAIFLNLPELKTIILEDEKNDSHKSWDQHPKYDTRPISRYLAKQRNLELIWGGNFPSVSALAKYEDVEIKKDAFPLVSVVDMKKEIKEGNTTAISNLLNRAIKDAVSSGKKVVLLINRRGGFTVILCRDCGFILKCNNCETPLITTPAEIEKEDPICKNCNTRQKAPDLCPNCKGHRFRMLGAGTQLLETDLKKIMPSVGVLRLDSDIAKDLVSQEKILENFLADSPQILVGTQMVIKPSYLKNISLCAIVNLEAAFLIPDYRGEEVVLQQAVDFRKMAVDNFIWQTYYPNHRVIESFKSGNYKKFLEDELKLRERFYWPPFVGLVKLTLQEKDKERGEKEAVFVYQKLSRVVPRKIKIYEPLLRRSSRLGKSYSWDILIKVAPGVKIKERNSILSYIPSKWEVDVDPISIL